MSTTATLAPSGIDRSVEYNSARVSLLVAASLALAKFVLHVVVNGSYGYHRDELLYRAMGTHLSPGYLEVPPGIAFLAWFSQNVLGDSLLALRLLPAVAGAALVFLTGLMARRFGGGPFAVAISCASVMVAPVFLRSATLFQPVVFDQLLWTLGAFILLAWIRDGDDRLWLVFGFVAGLGLLVKFSMLIYGFGVFGGLLLTEHRRVLRRPAPWLGAGIAAMMILPNLVWQAANEWPLLMHFGELSQTQLAHFSRLDFLLDQLIIHHPVTFPVWIAGLWFLVRQQDGAYRLLAWSFGLALLVLLLFRGKAYYLSAAFPMLFAAGGFMLEAWTHRRRSPPIWRSGLLLSLVLPGIALAPLGTPILSPGQLQQYMWFSGLARTVESDEIDALPQDFADMFGWEEKARAVANVYHGLPPEDQARAVLFAGNYGDAGAIDLFREELALPAAVSASSSYYLWGPGEKPGEILVTVGVPRRTLEQYYRDVRQAATATHRFALPSERNAPILVAREPRHSLQELWPDLHPFR